MKSKLHLQTEELRAVKAKFEEWRKSGPRGRKIPETLWQEAIGLTTRVSIGMVAKELGLGYSDFKRRVESAGASSEKAKTVSPKKPQEINVVRVAPVQVKPAESIDSEHSQRIIAEVKTAAGTIIRIFEGADASTMGALAACFGRGV